jgi:transposase
VEDWVGGRHTARFIREFVATLELKELKLDTVDREQGGVAYDPALLVQAWLYGYYRKIRSTRALEAACREDLGFIWLTGNHQPDHNALWRFRAEHHAVVHGLFRSSVKVAVELELVGLVLQAIDGTKIEAACSGRRGFDHRQLEKLLAQLERQLGEREQAIAAAGNQAAAALPAELEQASALREKVQRALERMESGATRHAHPQEPAAERMKCEGGNRFAYNAQAVVDAKEQIMVAAEVTTAANDTGQLVAMVRAAQANLPESPPDVAGRRRVRECGPVERGRALRVCGGDATAEQLARYLPPVSRGPLPT